MNEEIKIIFRKAIDPNEHIRNQAELELRKLQNNRAFILSIPSMLYKENDGLLKKMISLYYKNVVIGEWSKEDFSSAKQEIIKNICEIILNSEPQTLIAYNGVLTHIFNTEKIDICQDIVKKGTMMIKSGNMKTINAGLEIILSLFSSKKLKYMLENFLEIIYSNSGKEIVEGLNHFLSSGNYEMTSKIMKILSRSYNYYAIPEFLCIVDVFAYTINLTSQILREKNIDNSDLVKTKESAAFFLYKASEKGVKNFFKVSELSDFITDQNRFQFIYSVFIELIKSGEYEDDCYENIKIYATNFFTLCVSSKAYYRYIEADACFLISHFIFKSFLLTDDEEIDFECNPDKYLREKYHYYSYNLRNECSTLLLEFAKNFLNQKEGIEWLIGFFVTIFEKYRHNPNEETIKKKYGAVFMLSVGAHSIYKYDKPKLQYILINYILSDLRSDCLILKSHACYLFSSIDDKLDDNAALYAMLDSIRGMMNSDNKIIKTEATMGMSMFISNPQISDKFRLVIPEIIHSILVLSSQFDIEPLTFLLESIMQTYSDEISVYAVDLTKSLRLLILSHLSNTEEREDRIMVVSGFLRSVESIIFSLDNSKDTLKAVFENFKDVLLFIFENKKCDFYQEALDITNSFVYSLKYIDHTMWRIFQNILLLPKDEIVIYPNEVSDIIDNYISFGKDAVLDKNILESIFKIVNILCFVDDDEEFYGDDFISGCRIAESLILNVGESLLSIQPFRLEFFVRILFENIDKLDDESTAVILGLELIMNVFYIKPIETFCVLMNMHVVDTFFRNIFENESRFKRVHDKKICIRFLGRLFMLNTEQIPSNLNINRIVGLFTSLICTLPSAIETRNKLKDDHDANDVESADYNEGASDDYNELEEDIYFSTVLDSFDPFVYVSRIFNSVSNDIFASIVLRNLSREQYNAINEVLTTKHVTQKI